MRVLLLTYDSRGVRGSNRWRHSRCGCGNSARRCSCARRRTARSGWPRPACRCCPSARAQSFNALFGAALNTHRASAGLPPVDNIRDYVFTGHPWLAAARSTSRHCSAGWPPSCTTAARASRRRPPGPGAPQVVIPQWGDQPYWAGRVAGLGIGTAHDGPAPTTGSLSAALRTALAPETRARATAVAGTIRADGATVPATLLAARSAGKGRQRPREPHGIAGPGPTRTCAMAASDLRSELMP